MARLRHTASIFNYSDNVDIVRHPNTIDINFGKATPGFSATGSEPAIAPGNVNVASITMIHQGAINLMNALATQLGYTTTLIPPAPAPAPVAPAPAAEHMENEAPK